MSTVLIVESDEPLMRRMAWILGEAKIDVAAVHPGPDLVRDVQRHAPAVVVFNTDLPQDERSAYLRLVRALDPSPMIVDLHVHPGGRRGPMGARSADAYLHKPFDAESLVSTVMRLIERSRSDQGG